MIKTVISSYMDNQYLSIDLEIEGIEIANVNIKNSKLNVDIYKTSEDLSIDFNELISVLNYAKEELLKAYPEIKFLD